MRLSDLTVEVRDKALNRVGLIRPEEMDLTAQGDHNNVSSWSLTLAAEHPLTPALSTPGSGIIITGPNDILLSGPMTRTEHNQTADDPLGTVTFTGVGDSISLADALSFPDPTNIDPTTQTLAHDVRTGTVESVMYGFVDANIGPSAPAARRKAGLIMGTNLQRGPTITKSARFPVLGSLLYDLAASANLGFRIVQRDSNLVFETYAITDRTGEIRLDVQNGTLASSKVMVATPAATQVIIAGQGDLTERQFYAATNDEATQAETDWGRRIEMFVDQRQTDDPNEHIQKANEVLAQYGFTGINVQVVPTDDSTMRYGHDWGLGDLVTVVADNGERASTVTSFILKVDRDGTRLGVILGDASEFDEGAAVSQRVGELERRVGYLEAADPGVKVYGGTVTITPTAANTPTSKAVTFPPGYFTSAPTVSLTAISSAPGTSVTGVGATGVTATGFTAWLTRNSTTTTDLHWTAVGN